MLSCPIKSASKAMSLYFSMKFLANRCRKECGCTTANGMPTHDVPINHTMKYHLVLPLKYGFTAESKIPLQKGNFVHPQGKIAKKIAGYYTFELFLYFCRQNALKYGH